MQLHTDAGALPARRRLALGTPTLLEMAAVLAAVALLMPAFVRVAGFGDGRDGRYADASLGVQGLPEASLPAVCAAYAPWAEASVRERLCAAALATEAPGTTLP